MLLLLRCYNHPTMVRVKSSLATAWCNALLPGKYNSLPFETVGRELYKIIQSNRFYIYVYGTYRPTLS